MRALTCHHREPGCKTDQLCDWKRLVIGDVERRGVALTAELSHQFEGTRLNW